MPLRAFYTPNLTDSELTYEEVVGILADWLAEQRKYFIPTDEGTTAWLNRIGPKIHPHTEWWLKEILSYIKLFMGYGWIRKYGNSKKLKRDYYSHGQGRITF